MNRTQRRQIERDQRRGIDRNAGRVVMLPAAIDEFTVFDMPQTLLDKITQSGEIESLQGVIIFRDPSGDWNELCPALDGWIFTWEKISKDLNANLNLTALKRLNKKLYESMPLSKTDCDSANAALDDCRKLFRSCDRKQVMKIAKDAQIAILMEGKGE